MIKLSMLRLEQLGNSVCSFGSHILSSDIKIGRKIFFFYKASGPALERASLLNSWYVGIFLLGLYRLGHERDQ
jgi:hypothetical protein